MDEKEGTFFEIFKVLREERYYMNHSYMMSDFALGQINSLKKFFQMLYIMDVFFIGLNIFGKKLNITD